MNFHQLTYQISALHTELQSQAALAVNRALTLRNWLIGYYIVEFEQKGADRAQYGEQLLKKLEEAFHGMKGMDERAFRNHRKFYLTYPQIAEVLNKNEIRRSLTTVLPPIKIQGSATPEFTQPSDIPSVDGEKLLSKLSYTHLENLSGIDDPLKRMFYEVECIKGNWSVRELKRQIESQYFERSGISKNPEKLSQITTEKAEPAKIEDIIKSPFTFEFLGIRAKDAVEESDLEQALIDNLQAFLLEMGNGFCFESRQKRILIDDEYYFVDLVFYHRILKCHVLVELKTEKFKHVHIAQLNSYVAWFKDEMQEAGDNPPVGILLCTEKGPKLVEYALSGMDHRLFISKYQVELPSKEQLQSFIKEQLKNL